MPCGILYAPISSLSANSEILGIKPKWPPTTLLSSFGNAKRFIPLTSPSPGPAEKSSVRLLGVFSLRNRSLSAFRSSSGTPVPTNPPNVIVSQLLIFLTASAAEINLLFTFSKPPCLFPGHTKIYSFL